MRRELTDPEGRLWHEIRGRRLDGIKFRRQMPILSYIVDSICLEAKLIVELDGASIRSRDMTPRAMLRSKQ